MLKMLLTAGCVAVWAFAPSAGAHSEEGHPESARMLDCDHPPADALTRLPAPLDQWAHVECMAAGQFLMQGKDWLWRYPGSFTAQVRVPAWSADLSEAAVGGRYFKRADVTAGSADDAAKLHDRFSRELELYAALTADKPPLTRAYTLRALNDLGQPLEVFFLYRSDRDIWAIVCAPDCRPEATFLIESRRH